MHKNDGNSDKFTAMIGFSKRAGKIVYGYDSLRKAKGVKLLAVSDTSSDNLMSDMARLAEKLNVPIVTAPKLEDIVGNNVKALGITEINMAHAIIDYISGGAEKYKIQFGSRR